MQNESGIPPELLVQSERLAPSLIHEMRHPLMGLKMGLQLMAETLGSQVKESEAWEIVRGQLNRLEELFSSYQDFFMPERVPAGPVLLSEVLQRAADLLVYRLRPLGDRFRLEATPGLLAHTSSNALLHATTNLLVNAVDALRDEQCRILVRASPSLTHPGHVEVRVSDEGSGIPVELRERIFEANFTTKGKGEGSGLGLAIARRMMVAMGGELLLTAEGDARRAPWARTEFCIRMPVAASATGPDRPAPPGPVPAPGARDTSVRPEQARVLVVDDERIIVMLLKRSLEAEGYQVSHASTGDAARALLNENEYELLVTDKNLPGTSGVDLALLARKRNPGMAVLLITAFASRDSAERLLALGIDEYLQKPFEADYLVKRVKLVIARRKALTEASLNPSPHERIGLLTDDAEQGVQARMALEAGGFQTLVLPSIRSMADLEPVHGLVVATSQCNDTLREAVWSIQERRPGFPVALLARGESLEDTITAILLGATGGLVTGNTAEGMREPFERCFRKPA